jgi:hypothetical protein
VATQLVGYQVVLISIELIMTFIVTIVIYKTVVFWDFVSCLIRTNWASVNLECSSSTQWEESNFNLNLNADLCLKLQQFSDNHFSFLE